MATTDKAFDVDEIAAKRRFETDTKRLRELQVIQAELKSLHKGSHVYTQIANGNVFLMTSLENALSHTEKELKSLSHINANPVNQETQSVRLL